MRLIEAPVGLFMYKETICLKTEYMNQKGGVEAYIVESGEVFWGGAKSQEGRNNLDVTPVSLDDLRPKGRWIPYHSEGYNPEYDLWFEWECSECHNNFANDEDEIPYNFCPSCGADMRGGGRWGSL